MLRYGPFEPSGEELFMLPECRAWLSLVAVVCELLQCVCVCCENIVQAVSAVTSCVDMQKPGVLRISGGVNNFNTSHVYVLVCFDSRKHTRVQ